MRAESIVQNVVAVMGNPWTCARRALLCVCLLLAPGSVRSNAQSDESLGVDDWEGVPIEFDVRFTVGTLEGPGPELFDEHPIPALTSDGGLYVADRGAYEIRFFDVSGRHVASFGSEGQGPGQFQRITSMALSAGEDSLYVFDAGTMRVTVYRTEDNRRIRDFIPELGRPSGYNMYALRTGRIVFVGYMPDTEGLVHIFDLEGRYLQTVADILSIGDTRYDNPVVRVQLGQGTLTELENGDWVVALFAPYRIVRVSTDGSVRWTMSDDVLPKPWEGYIEFTPTRYSVGYYPQITQICALDENRIIVSHSNYDEERSYVDIVDAERGSLEGRFPVGFEDEFHCSNPAGEKKGRAVVQHEHPFPLHAFLSSGGGLLRVRGDADSLTEESPRSFRPLLPSLNHPI